MRPRAPRRAGLTAAERAELDELAREVVMLRAGAARVLERHGRKVRVLWWGRCQWCGRPRWLQWCHVHSKGAAPALRWWPVNAWAGCVRCHLYRWHDNPNDAVAFTVRLLGNYRAGLLAYQAKALHGHPDYEATRLALMMERARLLGRDGTNGGQERGGRAAGRAVRDAGNAGGRRGW